MTTESVFGGTTVQTQTMPSLKDWSKVLQLIDTKNYLDMVEHMLKREIPDKKNPKEWLRPPGIKPMMNQLGIMNMQGILRSIMDKTISQGNLSESKTYNRILKDILSELNDNLFYNDQEYELRQEDRKYVYGIMKAGIKIYLTRLIQDRERKYIHGKDDTHKFESIHLPKRTKGDAGSVYN